MKNFLLACVLLSLFSQSIAKPNKSLPTDSNSPWIVDVYYDDYAQLKKYAKINEPWTINKSKKYFTVSVDNLHQYQELFSYGFSVEINQKLTQSNSKSEAIISEVLKNKNLNEINSIPDRACIRTVEETFSTMDSLVAANPTLATIIDIGDTWEKENAGGLPGFDMRIIKITNSAIAGPKPKLFTTSSIHARELAPAELSTRFAEYLLNNYNTDADARWIVDHREVHLLLQGNPDGRKRAESINPNKRKNENNNFCSGGNKGIDMNRNFIYKWGEGQCTGSCSSTNPCSDTFRGTSAQSESENSAIDAYLKSLFIDNRGENLNDAAPADTTGIYIDIHSYSDLVLFPYGFSDPNFVQLAPNHAQLQTLARKFSWFNSYTPMPSNDLYGADGAADDNAYGQLGLASYTFELGNTGFRPDCSYFEATILPDNLKALIYASKVSDTPYITASGPDVEGLSLDATDVVASTNIEITGISTDEHFYNDRTANPPVSPHVLEPPESTQNIATVEMYVDELPWAAGSTPINLSATDGSFNSSVEPFIGQVDTSGMANGEHALYVQVTDADGITGVVYSKLFNIVDPADIGDLVGTIKDANTNLPIESASMNLNNFQTLSNATGQYNFSLLAGNYDLSANKQGYAPVTINNVVITGTQTTTQDILLQPICALLDETTEALGNINDAVNVGWSHAAGQGSDDWSIDLTAGNFNPHAFKTHDASQTTDKWLISPSVDLTANSILEFWHKHAFEGNDPYYDGAVLEISIDNGTSWSDLGSEISQGGYNATLANGNPLSNRPGWGGNLPTFTKVVVNLASYAGNTAKIRWRFAADTNVGAGDWLIDDILVLDPSACFTDVLFSNSFE